MPWSLSFNQQWGIVWTARVSTNTVEHCNITHEHLLRQFLCQIFCPSNTTRVFVFVETLLHLAGTIQFLEGTNLVFKHSHFIATNLATHMMFVFWSFEVVDQDRIQGLIVGSDLARLQWMLFHDKIRVFWLTTHTIHHEWYSKVSKRASNTATCL